MLYPAMDARRDSGRVEAVELWHRSDSMSYQLIHGDCLEVMPTLADKSIDAIICDPPYGTTNCSWDSVIPFEPLWTQYKRIIKPRGAIVLFGSQPFTSALVMSNIEWFRDALVWDKVAPTGYLDANRKHLKSHEDILIFSDGQTTYNPQKTQGQPYTHNGRSSNFNGYSAADTTKTVCDGLRYPKSIVTESSSTAAYKRYHPTQKPVDLLAYLIRTYTNEGETVLDNTMGSGSTIVAAIQEGRRAIGIEQDAGYFQIAQKRCEEATYQPSLFAPQPTQWQPVAMFGDD